MTDADFLLAVLSELPGEWVYQYVILQRSQMERGCGMTVHSRAADLRKRGLTVDCKVETSVDGARRVSAYRLVPSLSPVAVSGAEWPGIATDESEVVSRPAHTSGRIADPPSHESEAASLTLFDEPRAQPAWR